MPIYFIAADGRIDTILGAECPELEAAMEAAGLLRVEAPEWYAADAYSYESGEFRAILGGEAQGSASLGAAKRLELARAAEDFIATLTPLELDLVRVTDPSRTAERYPQTWLAWARGQADLARLIEASPSATPEQVTQAQAIQAAYLSVVKWCARVTAGPLAAAYAGLAAAVAAGDPAAVEAVTFDATAYRIGAAGEGADPDPDVVREDLALTLADLALL